MWSKLLALLLFVSVASCLPQSRVVNGTNTDISHYPYMVSLRSFGSHSCGSSIIGSRWILTAAHCVSGQLARFLKVQYGVSNISEPTTNLASVKRIIIHKGYSPENNYANDIALLELSEQLVYNYKTIAPVNLPPQGYEIPQIPAGAPGILTGWGLNATGGSIQNRLQEVNLKIYSDEECQFRHKNETTSDHICGGVDEGGKGQCSGDSGGPLVHVTPKGLIQVGVVSWSVKPCTIYPYPGVYTKVSHYINWINENICASHQKACA